jgi:N-acetylglucosaminyldiphosphoundecaprenol N-acetyl-beta-D-mannosaminyltransferase
MEIPGILVNWGNQDKFRKVYYVNAHAMNLAHEEPDFRGFLQKADLVFCDGYGVKWLAGMMGINIPYRLTPPDWIDDFASETAKAKQSVFVIGDQDGIAETFGRALEKTHPGYKHAGSHHGFFVKTGPENRTILDKINDSGATHLLVGFGMPLQERWIETNAQQLQVRVAVGVGALFRWYIEFEKRAPKWMTDNGLEWALRFLRHPKRHFRRYVVGNPLLLMRVLYARFIRDSSSIDGRK